MSAARIEAVEKHIRWQHMEDAIFIWVENCDSSETQDCWSSCSASSASATTRAATSNRRSSSASWWRLRWSASPATAGPERSALHRRITAQTHTVGAWSDDAGDPGVRHGVVERPDAWLHLRGRRLVRRLRGAAGADRRRRGLVLDAGAGHHQRPVRPRPTGSLPGRLRPLHPRRKVPVHRIFSSFHKTRR